MKVSDAADLTKEDVLAAVGLSIRRSTTERVLSAVGFLGAGLLLGAAVGLLLAPKSGKGLREDVGLSIDRLKSRLPSTSAPKPNDVPAEASP